MSEQMSDPTYEPTEDPENYTTITISVCIACASGDCVSCYGGEACECRCKGEEVG